MQINSANSRYCVFIGFIHQRLAFNVKKRNEKEVSHGMPICLNKFSTIAYTMLYSIHSGLFVNKNSLFVFCHVNMQVGKPVFKYCSCSSWYLAHWTLTANISAVNPLSSKILEPRGLIYTVVPLLRDHLYFKNHVCHTVEPAVCGHPFSQEKVTTYSRWPFTAGSFTKKLTCVPAKWPQKAVWLLTAVAAYSRYHCI